MRQDELLLIQAINEMATGSPSVVTLGFLKSLDKIPPIQEEQSHTFLFANNALAGKYLSKLCYVKNI